MKPAAWVAGAFLAAAAAGLAQAQTLTDGSPGARLVPPAPAPETGTARLDLSEISFATGADVVGQTITEITRADSSHTVDVVRLTETRSGLTPAGYASPMGPAGARDAAYDVDYRRRWPAAASGEAGGYRYELTPEAGVGYGALGGSVAGGARLEVSREQRIADRLARMGVEDGARYGDKGRWYLFAAAEGRAVGFNMTPDAEGRGGWTTDPAALVADAQVGVGWRKGDMQTSVGYMVRRVRVEDRYAREAIDLPSSDQVVGLSFSYKPRR